MAVTIIEGVELKAETMPAAEGGIVPPRIRTRLGGLGGNGGNGVPIDRARFEGLGGPLDGITDRELDGLLMIALDGMETLPGLDETLKKYGAIIAPPGPVPSDKEVKAFIGNLRAKGFVRRPSLFKRIRSIFTC